MSTCEHDKSPLLVVDGEVVLGREAPRCSLARPRSPNNVLFKRRSSRGRRPGRRPPTPSVLSASGVQPRRVRERVEERVSEQVYPARFDEPIELDARCKRCGFSGWIDRTPLGHTCAPRGASSFMDARRLGVVA